MNGFQYTYKTSQEIFSYIPKIQELSFLDIVLVAGTLGLVVLSIFIIIPSIILSYKYFKSKKTKGNKKKILTQILLQKEIEDEVEREIKIEEEKKVV